MPGLLSAELQPRSVLRDKRAAPVEVVGQLAANGVGERTGRLANSVRKAGGGEEDRQGFPVVFGETILGLPKQARQEVQRIFVARSDEPSLIPLARNGKAGGEPVEPEVGGAAELSLGVAGREIGEQVRCDENARTAADGPGALRAIEESNPRLVVLDLMLPGLDGLSVMRRARALGGVLNLGPTTICTDVNACVKSC